MSSNGTGREERSPVDETSASKRRRIAFSCLECRRRKLKCDRTFPACGRCQKGGHPNTCTYDSEALESTLSQPSGGRTQAVPPGDSWTRTAPRLPSVARSFAADEGDEDFLRQQPAEDAIGRLQAQEERIRQLENRIIGLEKTAYGGRSQWQRSATSPELGKCELKNVLEQRDAAMRETMIFRGKSFKTQFYGASHHTSYLSHVSDQPVIGRCKILLLMASAPRIASVHEGHD